MEEVYPVMGIRTTDEVLNDHLRLRLEGDLEDDMARNYAADVVLLTGCGVFRGHDGVRASADSVQAARVQCAAQNG